MMHKDLSAPLAAVGMALLSFETQLIMFMVFVFMVFMDCFTRWMAIGAAWLKSQGCTAPGLWEAFRAIPAARRAGLISSQVMKKQGMEKLILYNVSVMTAAGADFLLESSGATPFLTSAIVSYLVVTETLSIVENLSEAGAGGLERLAQLVRKKMGGSAGGGNGTGVEIGSGMRLMARSGSGLGRLRRGSFGPGPYRQ